MFRSKDFMLMDVIDINGRKVGFVKDLFINFSQGRISGFLVCANSFFSKNSAVLTEDVISFDKIMVVRKITKGTALKFQELKNFDVINTEGDLIGTVEDIIYDMSFTLKGVVVTSGFLSKLFRGKKIILPNELLLGEKNLLFYGNNHKLSLTRIPHKIIGVDCDEKNI